jgi:hypothetical protein
VWLVGLQRSDSDPLSGLTDGSTPCVRWGAATDLGGRERMEDSYIAVPDVLERHRGVITEKSLSFFGVRLFVRNHFTLKCVKESLVHTFSITRGAV